MVEIRWRLPNSEHSSPFSIVVNGQPRCVSNGDPTHQSLTISISRYNLSQNPVPVPSFARLNCERASDGKPSFARDQAKVPR